MAKQSSTSASQQPSREAFYILPDGLFRALLNAIPAGRIEDGQIDREFQASSAVGSGSVGQWNGRLINSYHLAPPAPITELEVPDKIPGWSPEEIRATRALSGPVDRKLAAQREPMAGYLGWLLSNRVFLREHDDLLTRHEEFIKQHGLPRMGAVGASAIVDAEGAQPLQQNAGHAGWVRQGARGDGQSGQGGALAEFVDSFESFYVRWRLQALDGPYLPAPLAPQLPVFHLPSVLGHIKSGGQTFYMPDIFPMPSRDELRDLIEEHLRPAGEAPEHLEEWIKLVGKQQTAKNQIARYARLFPLQHYVRALYSRHAQALQGVKGRLQDALGQFFRVSADTIRADMDLLSERLGTEWETVSRDF